MKYAPPDDRGRKPWVRTTSQWGRTHSSIVYAKTSQAAKHAFRRGTLESVTVRRATPEDVATLHVESVRL